MVPSTWCLHSIITSHTPLFFSSTHNTPCETNVVVGCICFGFFLNSFMRMKPIEMCMLSGFSSVVGGYRRVLCQNDFSRLLPLLPLPSSFYCFSWLAQCQLLMANGRLASRSYVRAPNENTYTTDIFGHRLMWHVLRYLYAVNTILLIFIDPLR